MKKIIDFYSKGTTKQVAIRIIVTLLIIAIIYFSTKAIIEAIRKKQAANKLAEIPENLQNSYNQPEENGGGIGGFADGSSLTAQQMTQYEPTAQLIAEQQYAAMQGTGTNEEVLFDSILGLNGAQLIMVNTAYGVKEGKNLFQWYIDELCGGALEGCVTLSYYDDSTPGCSSWWNSCSEKGFMQEIWKRAFGNSVPF
jgi:hypothetical protein